MKTTNYGSGHGMPAESKEVKPSKQEQEIQKTAEQLPKAEETTNVHDSKHFPFQIVEVTKNNEEGEFKAFYVGTMNHLISETIFATKKAAEDYIAKRPWELITNLICVTIQNAFEYEKFKSKH